MSEPTSEPYEPAGTQILWGRVLVLLLALALAFWLGTTFGGDDGSQRQLTEQRDEITRLEAQVTSLEAELAAVGTAADVSAGDRPAEQPSAAASEVAAASQSQRKKSDKKSNKSEQPKDPSRSNGQTYTIQSGDSLASIAQEVYGDPTKWRDIAQANELREPYSLTVGQSLEIPELN